MISARFHSSRLTRAVASLCIVTQVLFPVASTAGHRVAAPQAAPAVLSEQDATAAQVAGMTTQAAGMLQSGMNSRQAAEMARGYATSTAQSAFQEWLSQWGTVRVTLGLDEDFTLKGSAFDLLLPWHDTPENLLFTQHSFHRTDDRNQLNTGAGWRHFAPDYMAGVNLFFDHDLTRYHSRMGLGGEYWRDNLKLGANGYLRLSGWRDAPELDYDYEARPANGWDVRAEGYLPAYPQLGATLMYEQYYGDEVALFGKDKRQQDPHAFTAGLSYTPVPLISLSAEQKQGKGGENDTRFALNLTYTPGVSLARQLDPDAVAYRRSLAGSRHDLVERNNNIVLEYRKKELVKLQLHDPVTGKGGEQKPLVASLQSKYALKTLRAEAAELQSAGGVVNTEANQVTVTLPEYRYTATPQTDNVYRVAVTAEDEKGNRSNREEASVVVLAPQLSAQHSQVTSDKTTLKPDGTEKAVLTFRAQDAEGKAVSALTVSTSFTAPQGMALVLSDTFTETETKGTYTAELKGTIPGEVRVMPQVAGKDAAKDAVTVTLVNTTPVSEHSSITLSPAVSRADRAGQAFRAGDAVTATVILRDEQQRPVIHQAALPSSLCLRPEVSLYPNQNTGLYL
ncbi:inverse autotransporter beta domain-containing protein [Escherichia fergusonii]|uniref:inverse autotransporter beta domain-containing protein n=2 Tax=Escherichia fergusonii TaxID=564 RepID=UPI0028FCA01F|nr:inverse autotransporter beta domain-containing protein [Escherichia fergusonii]